MGTTLREIIFDIGGGIKGRRRNSKPCRSAGRAAAVSRRSILDLPLDYDSLKHVGAIMGSGGLVVMDEDTCMAEVARFFMKFTQKESCGKCIPCREGTKRMLEALERIVGNEGSEEDIELLEDLSDTISHTALCGLGQSACKPVQSTLRYFREDYERHVRDKFCPLCNGKPKVLQIDPEKCKGCSLCARNCPVERDHRRGQEAVRDRHGKVHHAATPASRTASSARFGRCKAYGKGNHVYQRPASSRSTGRTTFSP